MDYNVQTSCCSNEGWLMAHQQKPGRNQGISKGDFDTERGGSQTPLDCIGTWWRVARSSLKPFLFYTILLSYYFRTLRKQIGNTPAVMWRNCRELSGMLVWSSRGLVIFSATDIEVGHFSFRFLFFLPSFFCIQWLARWLRQKWSSICHSVL